MVKLEKRGGNGASQKERGGGGESAGREKRKSKEVCIKTRSTSVSLACSKRSDSGERCEVKKGMKSRGGLGREVREPSLPSLTSPPPSLLFFRAPFTSHRSPLSERLEQATVSNSLET